MSKRSFDQIDLEISAAIAEINAKQSDSIGPKSIFGNYTIADLKSTGFTPKTTPVKTKDNCLIALIRRAAEKVFEELGRGHVETVYRDALAYELQSVAVRLAYDGCQLKNKTEVVLPVYLDDDPVGNKRMDLMLKFKAPDTGDAVQTIVIELKALNSALNVNHAQQTLSYLRMSSAVCAILINFDQRSAQVQKMLDSPQKDNVVYDSEQLAPRSNLVLEFYAMK